MKVFFDTEFTGLHKNTTLISIGLVDGNGRTFYAEFSDYDRSQVNDWILENVISHLKFAGAATPGPQINIYEDRWEVYGEKKEVKEVLRDWLSKYDKVQLVSDVCHYDMVLFIDIFGSAFDIPSNVCPYCYDINHDIAELCVISDAEAFDKSREELCYRDIEGDKHNALYDAKVIKEIYGYCHPYEVLNS